MTVHLDVLKRYRAEPGLNFDGLVICDGQGLPQLVARTSTRADADLIVTALNNYAGAVGAIGDAIQLLQGCRDGDAVDARALLKAAHAKFGALSSPRTGPAKETE